jgi:hypothetical protein
MTALSRRYAWQKYKRASLRMVKRDDKNDGSKEREVNIFVI